MRLVSGSHSVGQGPIFICSSLPSTGGMSSEIGWFGRCVSRGFQETAEKLGIVIHALALAPDHVHVFVGACKNYSVVEVVRRLKGASSRRIRLECWERVRGKLWGESFWSGGYFYRSVGSTTGEAIQYYIKKSQGKHWAALDYETYTHGTNQTTINQFTA